MPKDSPLRRYRLSRNSWPSLIFPMLVIFASASYTFAHRVVLFAYVQGDRVFTESYFSDGRRCQNSRIEVFDSFGNKLLEGKTDNNGEFSFEPPKRMELKIVLTAGMGHRDEYVLPAGELLAEGNIGKFDPRQGKEMVSQGEKEGEKGTPASQLSRVEMEQIRTVVEEALDEKLRPIVRHLAKRRNEGVSFIQVMGGIGFIFGIMGIILYVRSRRGR
jgi:nickel transport protein